MNFRAFSVYSISSLANEGFKRGASLESRRSVLLHHHAAGETNKDLEFQVTRRSSKTSPAVRRPHLPLWRGHTQLLAFIRGLKGILDSPSMSGLPYAWHFNQFRAKKTQCSPAAAVSHDWSRSHTEDPSVARCLEKWRNVWFYLKTLRLRKPLAEAHRRPLTVKLSLRVQTSSPMNHRSPLLV